MEQLDVVERPGADERRGDRLGPRRDVYVVASDNTLWHKYMDGDGVWSEWIQVNTTVYQGGVLTASNLLPSIHEINIVPTVAGPSPRLIRYPW